MERAQSVGRLCWEPPRVAVNPASAPHSPDPAPRAAGSPRQDSQPAVDVTAITSRDDFLLELGQALGGQAAVRPVDSLEEALQSMAGGQSGHGVGIEARGGAEGGAGGAAGP